MDAFRPFSWSFLAQCSFLLLFTVAILVLYSGLWPRGIPSCEHSKHVDAPANGPIARDQSCPQASPAERTMNLHSAEVMRSQDSPQGAKNKQPYDAFLILDVEATCVVGTKKFDYPNEIIEWPVCLLHWKDKDSHGRAGTLQIVDEFRSFVKPTWRPQLSQFCTDLTGITQEQVDSAPTFTQLVDIFRVFLERHGLIEPGTGRRLAHFCWCSDGPFDVRDFVVKQCFMSKITMPSWLRGDVLDVRSAVGHWYLTNVNMPQAHHEKTNAQRAFPLPKRLSLAISRQLHVLDLAPFQGRQHSGIDDTRNITRIVIELARRGVKLQPNTAINPNRRWPWMGKRGRVVEGYY